MATIKQKKAIKEVGVNGGNISKAMRAAGYSEEVSKRTDKLTNTKGWKELMEEFLPDAELAKVHQEGLKAVRIHSSMTEPDRIENDYATRHKYLDTAYKLKGAYAPEKTLNVNVDLKAALPEKKIQEINEIALDE